MEIALDTKYDIGDSVVVDKEFVGKIVGIVVTIKPVPEANSNALLADKIYLVEIKNDIHEIEEQLLERYNF